MVKTGKLPTSVSGSEKPLYKDSKKKKSEESALRRRLRIGSGDRSERKRRTKSRLYQATRGPVERKPRWAEYLLHQAKRTRNKKRSSNEPKLWSFAIIDRIQSWSRIDFDVTVPSRMTKSAKRFFLNRNTITSGQAFARKVREFSCLRLWSATFRIIYNFIPDKSFRNLDNINKR